MPANPISQRRHALTGACRVSHTCASQCTILLWLSCHAEHLINTSALCSYRLLMLLPFPLQGGLAHGQQAALLRGLACRDFAVAAHRVLDRSRESGTTLDMRSDHVTAAVHAVPMSPRSMGGIISWRGSRCKVET